MSSSSTPRSPAAGEKALSLQTSADSFDENNPPSPKLRGLSKFVSTTSVLHQVPEVVLNTIMGTPRDVNDDGSTSSKLKIEVIQAISSDEAVVKWSFSIEGGKTGIEIVVKLKVTKRMDGDITVSAESVELPSASIEEPSNPRTKLVRIVLEKGIISLQPEKLEQTAFTFSAKAGIAIANGGESEKKPPNADRVNSSTSAYSSKKIITPLSLPTFKTGNQDVEDLEYKGTRHEITGDQRMVRAGIRGVYIVKELTDNTCEWTWAQQLDLKIKAMTKKLLAFIVWQQLGWVDEMYEKFKRNGMEVDRENREVLIKVMKARRGTPLMEDQVEIFERCSALLGEEGGGGWKPLSSKNAEVKMAIKYFPPKKGERSVLTGKAVGVVDSSAEEVAAWVMDYCSNGRMRVSREEDNSPRLELREKRRENEATFVTVKPLTVLLDKREFVFRMIWRSEGGKMTVAVEVKFDRSEDFDVRRRAELGRMIKKAKSTQESSAEALKRFEDLYSERRDCEQPRKDFGLAHESKVHATLFGGHGWGRTSVKVRAELTEVAAFLWDFGSRAGMRISADVERTFQTKFVEGELILKKEIQRRQKLESHLGVHHTDRTFNSIMTLTWTSSDTIILSVIPQDEDGNSVRGTARSKSERARGSVLMSDKDAVTAKENVVIRLKKLECIGEKEGTQIATLRRTVLCYGSTGKAAKKC
ncbi:hypothetical protein TrST_g7877 [Triparma strigata]|uniref:Uncharacterized protein n=1 Tax=Triparma strigata TaxID=1606541 RepID=A0A9W7AZZ8_9STRA|nr:hypothetical protein TrST_g7877 [Triparma strigata]